MRGISQRWFWPAVIVLLATYFNWGHIRAYLPALWVWAAEPVTSAQYDGVDARLIGLLEKGQYGELEDGCRQQLSKTPGSAPVLRMLGEAQEIRGRYAEARSSYEQAIRANPRSYGTRLQLAKLLRLIGERDLERKTLVELVPMLRALEERSAAEETVLGEALYLLELYHDSNEAYQRALKKDARYVPALVRRGQLFAEKQDFPYAAQLFKEALKLHPDSVEAMMGLAITMPDGAASESEGLAQKVLSVNPRSMEAQGFLATRAIHSDSLDEARKHVDAALAVNSNYPEALGLSAAIYYFLGDDLGYRQELAKIRTVSRSNPEAYNLLSELCGTRYRYQEAADFARQALVEDADYWPAHATLGVNLLRLGNLVEGKQFLETAFKHDPFDVRVKNTLVLLDSLEKFQTVAWGDFKVLLDKDEAAVMEGYVRDLLEEASSKMTARYRFKPQGPVQVEIYPEHGDFAVRTLGLPGIGALGACFGRVVVMDSPRAKKQGEYTWGSTLWHEYVHVLTLQCSNFRIPRWMSEGISVMEERRGRPGWGDDLNLVFLQAIKENQLLEMARLNDGFHRPKSPFQVGLSYYQASKVCEYLESRYGWDKMLIMLDNYRQGWSTPRVFKETLGVELKDFDKEFREHLKTEIGAYMEAVDFGVAKKLQSKPADQETLEELLKSHPNEFFINLRLGKMRFEANDLEGAEKCLLRAQAAFPLYGEEDNPYLLLADLYEKKGRPDLAIGQLASFLKVNEGNYQIAMRLAKLLLAAERHSEAQQALMAAAYLNPFDGAMHKLLGDLFLQDGKHRQAVREFQVLLALNPTDKAGAYYDLSRAYLASGLKAQAKTAVLKALEIAPSFAEAQDLLLKIVGD